jgi:hypothetical protein
MNANRLLVPALIVGVVTLAAASYIVGPPIRWSAIDHTAPPLEELVEPPLLKEEVLVNAFGLLPRCDAPQAVSTVTGLLRRRALEHIEGLTDIELVTLIGPGRLSCQAFVETGGRKVSVHFQLVSNPSRTGGWIVTVDP